MDKIATAIESKDWQALHLAALELANSSNISISELGKILELLPFIVIAFPDSSIMEYKDEKIIWYRYETLIWQLGEAFRHILKKRKEFRKDRNLFRAVENVCLDRTFGKGRECFVMLLGQYGDREVINTLLKLLDDSQVHGHAIYALRLLGASEAQDNIRPFLQSSKTWVRNEAKKYFQKIVNQRPQS